MAMKNYRNIASYILAPLAAIMTFGIMCQLFINPSSITLYFFMTIIILNATSKSWGILEWSCVLILACLYFAMMFFAFLCWQPLMYLMSILLPVYSTWILLKGKPYWIYFAIFIVYLSVGCCCFFNNHIIGPMSFLISDLPIDIPSQWFHCYRFFWAGVLLDMITTNAGIISVSILLLYMIWKEQKKRVS